MPTINQLVKKNRQKKTRKSKSPVLNVGFNTLERKQTDAKSPQKRGVCTRVGTKHQRNQTQHYVNMLVLDFQMVKKSMHIFLEKDITYKNIA